MRIALFGQPRILSDDGLHEYALPRKTLNVLAYLILNRRRAPTRDTIAFALFPDEDEETARAALRRNLMHLMQAFPDARAFIDVEAERIAWNLEAPAHIDVLAFEQAAGAGRDADAIAEYAGPLLPTIYDEWTTADRERLRDAFHAALGRTIARDRSRRNYDAAMATAHRLLDDDPWREDIVRQLMAIRYESGDRAGALAVFERFAALLRGELRTDPMVETLSLRDAMLRGAPLATSERASSIRPELAALDVALPFVGRDAAMQHGRAAWQSAGDGRPQVLFVSGEAGVGKSRFTTELVRLAEREGGVIARGYTAAGGEREPYEAFFEAFHGAPSLLEERAGAILTDNRAARLRFFESVRHHVASLSRARPMVLVLEDLHWAGASTIELLDFIARRLARAPVLLVVTSRNDDLARGHPLRDLRRELERTGFATEIVLDRLTTEDATRAARGVLADSVDAAALSRATEWVAGVPLLLVEAVRDLAAGRASTASSVTTLVAERLERLSPSAETALVFGAVLGERFDLATLVAATAWRDDQVLDALAEAIECGFVRAAARTRSFAFEFTHDLIRVAAMQRISEGDLRRAHGLAARAILAEDTGAGSRAQAIARHFAAAGESLRAAEHFGHAAHHALSVFANEDARRNASDGLAQCDDRDPAQRALRYRLIDLREQSLARIGARALRRADAEQLVALAEGSEQTAAALGRLFEANVTESAGRCAVLERLAVLTGDCAVAERTHMLMTARHAYLEGEYATAREWALRAAAACEAAGEDEAAIRARFIVVTSLNRLGSFVQATEDVRALRTLLDGGTDEVLSAEFHLVASAALAETQRDAALDDARRSLELALRVGDRFMEARARQNVAVIAGKLRHYEAALTEQERALAAYRDVGDAPGVRDALLNIAGVRIWCGDYARPRQLLDEVEVTDEATPWLALRCQLIRGALAARTEHVNDALHYLDDALRRAEELGASLYQARCRLELANAHALEGRVEVASEFIEVALAEFAVMGQPELEVEALALSARIQAQLGNGDEARKRSERARTRCEGRRLQSYSEIAWNLGAAYAQLGEEEAARAFARDAIAAAVDDALRMPADLAETYLQLRWHREALAFISPRSRAEQSDRRTVRGTR